jgi:TorA maturation chaperone TorD
LTELGLRRSPDVAEPEDHAAILLRIDVRACSPEMVRLRLKPSARCSRRTLSLGSATFFADLEPAERSQFYRSVGALGRMYMELEAEAFALPA